MPKFLDYTRDAKITQIKHDVKVAEEVMEVYLIEHDGLPESPVDIETPLAEKRLWETRGLVESIQGDPGDYMDITGLEAIKDAKSKLDGQFVANDMGKVYYIADKVIEVGDSGQEDGDGTESGPILCSAIPNDEWRPTDIPWDATIVGSGAAMGGDDLTLEQLNNAYFGLPKEDAAHYTFNGVNYLGTEDYIISSTLLLTEYFIEMSLLGEYTPEEIITFGLTTQERLNAALALIEGLNSIDFNPTYTATYNEDGEIVDGSCQPIVVIDFTQLDSEMLQYENLEGNSSIYTDETWNDYTVAYNEALEIDENNSQEEVDAATSNLRAARESLIEKADLTDYNDLLGSVNEGDYSSESWDTYIEVVNSNQVTQGSSQTEIDNAIANISNAQSNLIPKDINEDYFDYIISNGEVEITNLKYVGKLHDSSNKEAWYFSAERNCC